MIFFALLILALSLCSVLTFVASYTEAHPFSQYDIVLGTDGFYYLATDFGDNSFLVPFHYHPDNVSDLFLDQQIAPSFIALARNTSVALSFSPTEKGGIIVAGVDLARILGNKDALFGLNVHSAFSEPFANSTVPVLTCIDANPEQWVVLFTSSNTTQGTISGNCVIIEYASAEEAIRLIDKLTYQLLGIPA